MNTPNPLVPQGALSQHSKKQANVKIAVVTILLAHVVVLGGLLIQGCKPDKKDAAVSHTNDTFAPMSNDVAMGSSTISNANPYASSAPTGSAPSVTGTTGAPAVVTGSTSNPPYELTGSAPLTNTATTTLTGNTGATKEYTIAKGDTLAVIAKKNGTTVKALQAANPSVVPSKLKVGSKIQVPDKVEGTSTTHTPIASASGDVTGTGAPATSANTSTYVVKPGDTLTKIATAHGVKVKELQTLNHLTTTVVRANQKLKLPAKNTTAHAEKVPVTTDLSTSTAGNSTPVATNSRTGLSTNR